jgi:hypothetical protein
MAAAVAKLVTNVRLVMNTNIQPMPYARPAKTNPLIVGRTKNARLNRFLEDVTFSQALLDGSHGSRKEKPNVKPHPHGHHLGRQLFYELARRMRL